MNAYQKKQKQKKRKSIFRKWHRRMGFVAAIFVVNLSITGIILNHYESFSLHKSYIESEWLLDAYNIKPPRQANCFSNNGQSVCQLDNLIYLNQQFWKETQHKLLGMHQLSNEIAVVTEARVFLLTEQLALIDELNISEELRANVLDHFSINNQLIINTEVGDYILDSEMGEWEDFNAATSSYTQRSPAGYNLSESELSTLQSDYRKRQISVLTFVQDLHSGRVFAKVGVILNDLAALLLILLVISGFITWQRRKSKPTDSAD